MRANWWFPEGIKPLMQSFRQDCNPYSTCQQLLEMVDKKPKIRGKSAMRRRAMIATCELFKDPIWELVESCLRGNPNDIKQAQYLVVSGSRETSFTESRRSAAVICSSSEPSLTTHLFSWRGHNNKVSFRKDFQYLSSSLLNQNTIVHVYVFFATIFIYLQLSLQNRLLPIYPNHFSLQYSFLFLSRPIAANEHKQRNPLFPFVTSCMISSHIYLRDPTDLSGINPVKDFEMWDPLNEFKIPDYKIKSCVTWTVQQSDVFKVGSV